MQSLADPLGTLVLDNNPLSDLVWSKTLLFPICQSTLQYAAFDMDLVP